MPANSDVGEQPWRLKVVAQGGEDVVTFKMTVLAKKDSTPEPSEEPSETFSGGGVYHLYVLLMIVF